MVKVLTEPSQYQDLINGNPLSVRTNVPLPEKDRVRKGDTVEVICDRSKVHAKVISDPITVVSRPEEGYEEISIEVVKSD
jgi:hypothetical protein